MLDRAVEGSEPRGIFGVDRGSDVEKAFVRLGGFLPRPPRTAQWFWCLVCRAERGFRVREALDLGDALPSFEVCRVKRRSRLILGGECQQLVVGCQCRQLYTIPPPPPPRDSSTTTTRVGMRRRSFSIAGRVSLTSALAPAPASVNVTQPPAIWRVAVRKWTVTNGFMRPGNSYSTKAHKMGDHNEGQGLRDSGPSQPSVSMGREATLLTLEGHSSSVWLVAFSPDGKQVVSGSSTI
ncbi:hypothetical protein F5882DRAFT_100124 [Hyaloscypha sp. PMI_1271]|nr:hypothetical protein F5882DRAFT_100124 [Hyaloscypha sp. PMI_1271]